MHNRGHKVSPMSVKKIRDVVDIVMGIVGVFGSKTIGRVDIIDILDVRLPKIMPAFYLEVVEDHKLPNQYAITYPEQSLIQVRESVYDGARQSNRRDRFTLAHELGHLLLHRQPGGYARSSGNHKVYEDSEWQADVFAAELLMPYEEVVDLRSADEIARRFDVSEQAAQMRFDKIKKH